MCKKLIYYISKLISLDILMSVTEIQLTKEMKQNKCISFCFIRHLFRKGTTQQHTT